MTKLNDTFKIFCGGLVGGAVVDIVYIAMAGPSAFFSVIGITERYNVFLSHVALGGILGILFLMFIKKLPSLNVWLGGIIWAFLCLIIIGGIPAFLTKTITPITTISGIIVWLLFGFILSATVKLQVKNKSNEQ